MSDCGLPMPVCIQCGRGVGLCGVKIIGMSPTYLPTYLTSTIHPST